MSGLLLKLVQANKKLYFKDLNMFVIKQISSKINTAFISMTFICLMLFFAVCMLSSGIGLNKALNKNIKELTQFDTTFINYKGEDISKILENQGIALKDYSDSYVNYNIYYNKLGYRDFLNKYLTEKENSYYKISANEDIPIMKLSEFNNIMKMLGKQEITLQNNEYIVFTDAENIEALIEKVLKANTKIKVNGHELSPSKEKVIEVVTYNDIIKINLGTIVVEDSVVYNAPIIRSCLNLNYKKSTENIEEELNKSINKLDDNTKKAVNYKTKSEVLAKSAGIGVMLSYLAIYIGFIFLITSAAVLAIQQLSESNNNISRYKLLQKIGVDSDMINQSLLVQVAIYFMVPIALAIIHSIIGIKVASKLVILLVGSGIVNNIIFTAIVLIVIYGGYFIATYLGTKKIIRQYI
jgi:putative ABC transport system permease protein